MKEKIGGSYQSISFLGGSDGKESSYNAGDLGLIPGLGRSPGEGKGNPLQCTCLEYPIDRGACLATVCGVTKSQIWLKWLSTYACYIHNWNYFCAVHYRTNEYISFLIFFFFSLLLSILSFQVDLKHLGDRDLIVYFIVTSIS